MWWRDFRKWMMWLACYHYTWRGMHWPFTWRWKRLVSEMQSKSKPDWKRPSPMTRSQHTENWPWSSEPANAWTSSNKIRQLIGLACFKGAEMERLTKLALVTEFPDTISIELGQAPNIEALTMGDLLARVRVLMTTKNQSQVVAVHSPRSSVTPPAKNDLIASITCYRCSGKGHVVKDCWNHGTRCYRCGEVGH